MKVISTFSGCGGSSLGYKMAGGEIVLAIEIDDNAVTTYKKNHPTTQVYHGDIKNISTKEIMEMTNLKIGELDVLDGSPPCQGFSLTGKRKMKDKRNQLFKEYCRLLRELKPKTFVMENVAGMIKGNMKFLFLEIFNELKTCGYQVKAKLLNTKNYNVPQSRQRIIFIGVREDLEIKPSYPTPNKKIITVRQAFQGVKNDERMKPKGQVADYILKLKQGENISKYHPKKHHYSSFRISWDKPSPTIQKTFGKSRAFIAHPTLNLSLSINEVKRLFTFPDDYVFVGKFEDAWARMGNSVPPNFMKAIAEHIKKKILTQNGGEIDRKA